MALGVVHIRVALVRGPSIEVSRARAEVAPESLTVRRQTGEVLAVVEAERVPDAGVFRYETPEGTWTVRTQRACACGGTVVKELAT